MDYTNLILHAISKPLEWKEKANETDITWERKYYNKQSNKFKEAWKNIFGAEFSAVYEEDNGDTTDSEIQRICKMVQEDERIREWLESVRFIS